jgi:flagellin-specific chaperone FliS
MNKNNCPKCGAFLHPASLHTCKNVQIETKQSCENNIDEMLFNVLADMILSNKEVRQKLVEAERTLDEAIGILKELAASLEQSPTPEGEKETE